MTDKFAISHTFLNAGDALTPRDSSAAIIVNARGELLLQLRDDKESIFFPNHWGCFGGAADPGENYHQALLRELEEEIGISVDAATVAPFITITFTPKPDLKPIERVFFIVMLATETTGSLTLGEGRDVRFFTPVEAMQLANATPYDKFAIWLYLNQGRLLEA